MVSKLDLYRVFYEVGREKSFSKAAKSLYMTQPAVSQSIMQLEQEIDTKLFIRTPRGAELTKEGAILYEYIFSAMNLINTGEEKIYEARNLIMGELKIGVGDTISRYFLLSYLEKFNKLYPNIKLKIINSTTLQLCNILKSGKLDIAICNFPIDDNDLVMKETMEIEDIFVCGDKYKENFKEKIDFNDLMNYPLILLERESNSRRYVEKYILEKGVRIIPEIELGSHDLLLEFAKINLGIACVIREFSQDYLKRGLLYEVETKEKIPKRSIGYCYLKNLSLSPAAKKFIEVLEEKQS